MPQAVHSARAKHMSVATPYKQQSPAKIPLNDDRQEKAVRLQSRQALHDLQINSLKAAASPVRKVLNPNRAAGDSPKTPRVQIARGKENVEDGGFTVVTTNAMTPMKRVPILANFEEWMKMATDNKINATNSWNFALIDYFHDMSLLKEGDGVNFQKASCTLDGCVKIYTSRVDSVATETGKLLSGLADSGSKKTKRGEEESEAKEGADGDVDEEDDGKKKTREKRSSEATLAPSFASLQLKKFELEFSVDPLFKKASADFDEGGAKGLLLNHLAIDSTGRIVFDSSDDSGDMIPDASSTDHMKSKSAGQACNKDIEEAEIKEKGTPEKIEVGDIDINSLRARFFPDLARLDEQDVCPSLRNFHLGGPAGSLDVPFLNAPDDWRQGNQSSSKGSIGDQTGIFLDGDNVAGFDDDDGVLGGFDIGADAAFGEGGEAWAKDAAIESQLQIRDMGFVEGNNNEGEEKESIPVGDFDPDGNEYAVSLHHKKIDAGHVNIFSYFDNALKKNWAGPEHWRIRRIKNISKTSAPAPAKRKEKEPFEIDFASPLDPVIAEFIYTPAFSSSAISLPKSQWKSKTRNLLPDDKHFNSRQLLRLFLKPKARVGSYRAGSANQRQLKELGDAAGREVDEAYWARNQNMDKRVLPDEDLRQGDYDANFFQDDRLELGNVPADDDDEFEDAREAFPPDIGEGAAAGNHEFEDALNTAGTTQDGGFGSQLVTQSRRLRPDYVQYARVAKKVDVRRLKEEMWKGIGFQDNIDPQDQTSTKALAKIDKPPLRFTSVINGLQNVYPEQAMHDISTSYCFICLLHLANEKGLTLGNELGLEELSILNDKTALIAEGGA